MRSCLRPETPADALPIRELLVAAFGGTQEADLVDQLRHDGDLVLSLVTLARDGSAIAHVGFVRLVVEQGGDEIPAIGLAPLAVAPAAQRQGVGSVLVRRGLDRLRERGETLVFVLGDPAYYGRFGFDLAAAQAFTCVYAGAYFMALRLQPDAPRDGLVRYPAAFARVADAPL